VGRAHKDGRRLPLQRRRQVLCGGEGGAADDDEQVAPVVDAVAAEDLVDQRLVQGPVPAAVVAQIDHQIVDPGGLDGRHQAPEEGREALVLRVGDGIALTVDQRDLGEALEPENVVDVEGGRQGSRGVRVDRRPGLTRSNPAAQLDRDPLAVRPLRHQGDTVHVFVPNQLERRVWCNA
jgi:hypothetical protein